MRLRRALLIAAVLLVGSALAGVAQPHLGRSAGAPAKTITVSGHGTVTTTPDRASFDFTVETRAQTAAAAIARCSEAAAAVARAVKDAGVTPTDLQTSQISLSPQTTQDGTTIIGYAASNTVTAKSAIASAGAIVDAAVRAGANGVSGPNLSRSDETALYKTALRNAVADAGDKAGALAAAAGLTLGGVQSLAEGAGATPVVFAQKAADAGVAIEPGTQTVEADVTVTYAAGG
jgi:uncharacterized protein YggE